MKIENESLYDMERADMDMDEFREVVAKNAYYKAEKRGFADGYELEDWLEAEQEIIGDSGYLPR
jgi:hypothetical protein